ncbi:putative protein NPAT [Scophthalmus maximus]|uniref:Protein NPAT C-terminal domain-containing protein n=1 Tax=Scophthalmus maximus TaxID=52904 RepID=A0A2U9B691_SCOMX|nr:putative protein NPAT [Scophthalmus maximus]
MLLPSDFARLVLGYLQEEGLSATSQAFIHESPNLKEYAEHTTADGTIPACVFSVFGKSLTTILNEYVAAKAKESCHEVPAMMTSLWKKLDFTLNQIKSLQNSPAISAYQRTRSRVGLANMARQRVLTVVSSGGAVVCSSVSDTSSVLSPAHASHGALSHSTPVSFSAPHTRQLQQIPDGSRILNTPRDSPVHIIVSENRLNPGPMSPGRRKWDTPRKRGGALSGSSGLSRSAAATISNLNAEPQPEEAADHLVIQNARDRILGDRSLQEKLAENINKILANEPVPQTSKASAATVEPDQSIDEILGLQGEIHMSDDAIHDILEQTESDPAFQALFDLFDNNKNKFPDGETGDADVSSSPEESDAAGSSSTCLQSDDPGTSYREANVSDTNSVKSTAVQERKTRKAAAPTLLKKTLLAPSGRASRIEGSSATLLVSHRDHRRVSSAATGSNRRERASLFNSSVVVTPMDVDEPLNTPPPPSDTNMDSTATGLCEPTTVPSTSASLSLSSHPAFLPPVQVELSITPTPTAELSRTPLSSSGGDTRPASTHSATAESASSSVTVTAVPISPSDSIVAPFTATPDSPMCASASATLTATPASSTPDSPVSFSSSSCAPIAAAPDTSSSAAPSKATASSDNIVALKIIISDNQEEEDAPSDAALNQAITSISGDKIPTIYLSSPAKSPGFIPGIPGTPKTTLDEVALAVSGLQSSEARGSPVAAGKAFVASPLTGTSQAQQSYVIQLPMDATNAALQGTTAGYFLVTEPPTTDLQTRQVLLPAGLSKGRPFATTQFGATTPTLSQGYSAGSALILPSPVKPLVLPISVLGQNTLGNVQMVSNQLVARPSPVSVPQYEIVQSNSSTVATKPSTAAGSEENLVVKVIQPLTAENTSQQDAARRILRFDSSAEVQPQTSETAQTASPAATSQSSAQRPEKGKTPPVPRTRPAILGGNKPKRRVQIVRCSTGPQTAGGFVTEAEKSVTLQSQHHHKDPVKKNSRKQDHNVDSQETQSASTSRADSSGTETLKKLESRRRSKSADGTHNRDSDEAKASDCLSSRLSSSDSTTRSVTRKEKEESGRKEAAAEKPPAKSREGRSDRRTPSSSETPHVTANKENEIKGSAQEQHPPSTPTSSVSRDFSPPAVTLPIPNPESKATKTLSKTSSLAKQAAEMLQDIHGLHSPSSTPVKRPGAGSSDPPRTPGTGRTQEESAADCPRTPSRQKKGKDGEGTPRRPMPPNTPEVPTCSPASEAGSENSINMAAHTLMILSRAAIARTGTPLKDSLRQDGAGDKSPTSSKNSKKRKQPSPAESPSAKKETKRSSSKTRDREKKKLVDCFPHDLDVDKFLSSLHYDE